MRALVKFTGMRSIDIDKLRIKTPKISEYDWNLLSIS